MQYSKPIVMLLGMLAMPTLGRVCSLRTNIVDCGSAESYDVSVSDVASDDFVTLVDSGKMFAALNAAPAHLAASYAGLKSFGESSAAAQGITASGTSSKSKGDLDVGGTGLDDCESDCCTF